MDKGCEHYISCFNYGVCHKHIDMYRCSCKGNKSRCDFFPEVREGAFEEKYKKLVPKIPPLNISGYESPITTHISNVQKSFNEKVDEQILETIEYELGVHVDKEELVKALKYDREQYEKGVADGYEQGHKDG